MPQQAFALGQLPQMPKFDVNKVGNTNQTTPSPLGFNQPMPMGGAMYGNMIGGADLT